MSPVAGEDRAQPMDDSRGLIAVFARPVRAGGVKTRLSPALGDGGAARLYAAFLSDVVATARAVPDCDVQLWVAGDPDHASLRNYDVPRVAQPDTDLGGRMTHALQQGAGRPTLVIGSDAPTMPRQLLVTALGLLRSGDVDVVLGPAVDGGFTLIGARAGRLPDLGPPIRWSQPETLAETLAACSRGGLRVGQLTPWYDVDVPEDLRVLSVHLALRPGAAPATAAELARGSE